MDDLAKIPMGGLTKAQIYDAFQEKIAKSAILKIDDEWQIVGKYCRVTWDGEGTWDIWICNPTNIPAGLSQRKVRSMLSRWKTRTGTTFRELTGEAYTKVADKEEIIQNLDLLGIRKKRNVSVQQRQELANRLRSEAA